MFVEERIQKLERIKAKESRKQYLRLDMNENPAGLPEHFMREVLSSITTEEIAMYPEIFELQEKLAALHGVRPDNILVTNGSDEGIKSIFEVFGKAGKEIVAVYPSFEMYRVYAEMYGLTCKWIYYDDNFCVSADEISRSITEDTAIVSLLNPNNPIGTVYTEEEVMSILERARDVGAIVIIDEAYYYFHDKTFAEIAIRYENVILLRTFSKLCSLAGCRIGYLVAMPELIRLVDAVRPSSCVNVFAIKLATAILNRTDIIEDLKKKELEGRKFLTKELKKCGYKVIEGEGNYVLFRSNRKPQQVADEMKRRGILIKTFHIPLLSDYVRITTSKKEFMEQVLEELREIDRGTIN